MGQKLHEINELKDKIAELELQNKLLTANAVKQAQLISANKKEKEGLIRSAKERRDKIKQLTSDKNSQGKIISKLEATISELETKLAESMTNKYLVRKIPSGRRPKMDSMKSPRRQAPQVQKFLKEVEKDNEQF